MNIIILTLLFFTHTFYAMTTHQTPETLYREIIAQPVHESLWKNFHYSQESLEKAECHKLAQTLYGSIKSIPEAKQIAVMAVCRQKHPQPEQDTLLIRKADGSYPAKLKEIQNLLLHGANINVIGYGGNSVLHFLASKSYTDPEVIEFIINKGINLDMKNEEGQTSLHSTAQAQNIKLLKLLLDYGVDPTIKDQWGKTVFDYQQIAAQ